MEWSEVSVTKRLHNNLRNIGSSHIVTPFYDYSRPRQWIHNNVFDFMSQAIT